MKSKFSLSSIIVLAGLFLLSPLSQAHESGEYIVRFGPATVSPDEDSSNLALNGTDIPGTGVSVDDNTQLGLTITMMVSDHVGLELLAATPFSHTVTAEGLGADLDTADVKHLPPTFSVQYYPASSSSSFQPYFGAGVNYTVFFSEDLTSDFVGVFGSGDIELDSSVGLALEVGFDYQLSNNWLLNFSVWKVDIGTSATIDLDSGNTIEVDVDIDPIAYMLSLGYKF